MKRIVFILMMFLSSICFASDYMEVTPSAYTYKDIYDGLYWTQSTDQTGLTGDKSGSFDLTSTGIVTVNNDSGYVKLGSIATGYGAMGCLSTLTISNYALTQTATETFLNSPSTLYFATNGNDIKGSISDTGNWAIGNNPTTINPILYHLGYVNLASRYVSWQLSDTDDYYHLERGDASVLGLKIDMPVDLGANTLGAGAITGSSLVVDTDTLVVNSTTHRVGIGAGTPDVKLHVATNNATAVMRLERNQAAISSSDIVGRIEVETQDTTDPGICAKLEALSYGTSGETGWRLSTGTPSVLAEAMQIDPYGAVGIGTAWPDSPDALLHLSHATDTYLRFTRNDTTMVTDEIVGRLEFETRDTDSAGVGAYIQAIAEGNAGEVGLSIGTGSGGAAVERLRISNIGAATFTGTLGAGATTLTSLVVDTTTLVVNAAGYEDKVGIGTASPSYKLSVGSANGSDQIGTYHDNTNAYLKWTDGELNLMTDEGTDTVSTVNITGKGTGYAKLAIHDGNGTQTLSLFQLSADSYIDSGNGVLNLAYSNDNGGPAATFFVDTTGSPNVMIYGYDSGAGALRFASLEVGSDGTLNFDAPAGEDFRLGQYGGSAYMTMKSTGNVGIGTTAPDRKLEINTGAATGGMRLTYNDANGSATIYSDFLIDSNGDLAITATGGDISFGDENLLTTGTFGAGFVGIGVTAPDARLEIEGSTTIGQQLLTIDQNDADQAFIDYQGTSAADAANNISTWTVATIAGYVKVEINGSAYWMPYYNAPTS